MLGLLGLFQDKQSRSKARYVLALKDRHRCRILPEARRVLCLGGAGKRPRSENGLLQSVETRGPAKSKQQQTSLNLFSAIPSGSEVMTSEFLR